MTMENTYRRFVCILICLAICIFHSKDISAAKLFVVSAQGPVSTGEIWRYELSGPNDTAVLEVTLTHPTLDNSRDLTFNSAGDMFVVNHGIHMNGGGGSISKFKNPAGSMTFDSNFITPDFNTPWSIVFRNKELFVTQIFGNNILRFLFSPTGAPIPNGIVTSGLGGNSTRGIILLKLR